MNPDLFLADFGHIANAPEGINRLREMIYSLAVTGALSEQRRSDGDGHSLLTEIAAKKQALSDAGVYKRSPKLENLHDAFNENLPKIPSAWAWSRLVEVGEISPKNEAEDDVIASFASMSAISEMHSSAVASEDRPWGNIKKGYTHFANGDVVLAKITPCFENGKAAVMANLTNGVGAGTTELHVVRPIAGVIEPGYIYAFLRSPYFKIVGEGHMTGTAGQKRLPTEYFATRPFPLPPLAEQKRIVAKVDELMALCDQLEAQQQERERHFPVLSRTCHLRFAKAPTPANLNRIFDDTGTVSPADLRRTILTLAVKGKLAAQYPNDEPAVQGLRSCSVDVERWGVPQDAERFDVPPSWTWLRFAGVGEQRLGKMLDAQKNRGDAKPYLRNTNVQWMRFGLDDVKEMRVEGREEEELRLKHGDLLICEGGEPGRCAIWRDEVPEMYFQKALHRIRPCDAVLSEFLALNLQIDCQNGVLASYFTGATIKHLTGRSLSTYPIPIPPLAEQHRIVAKVDELMALVDHLEAQQQERDKLAEAFAKACVASFTGTSQLERPEKMKAPKTELVSLVTLGKKPKPDDKAPLAKLLSQHKGTLPAKSLWQQSGLTIDAFYQQLKAEIAQGWIAPPAVAEMKVMEQA